MDIGYFHVLPIVNSAAVNIGGTCFFLITVFSGYMPGVRLLGHILVLFLVFKEPPYYFPQWLYQFTFPPSVQEDSSFSIPSPAFNVCRFFSISRNWLVLGVEVSSGQQGPKISKR